jgi:hypothetical protein
LDAIVRVLGVAGFDRPLRGGVMVLRWLAFHSFFPEVGVQRLASTR